MNKKIIMVVVMMLNLIGAAQARDFRPTAATGNWAVGSKWDVGTVPTEEDRAFLGGATYDVNSNISIGYVNLGYIYSGGVNVAAGAYFHVKYALYVGQTYEGNNEVGTLNLYGTAYAEQLSVAVDAENARGVLNVYNGGHLTVGYEACSIGNTGTNSGAGGIVNLNGSGCITVLCSTGIIIAANGKINLGKGGRVEVLGDWRSQMQGYIDENKITAFARCRPVISYKNGYTYVVGSNDCTCTTYSAGDLNQDCYVDMLDFAMIAAHWFDCTEPTNSTCVQ